MLAACFVADDDDRRDLDLLRFTFFSSAAAAAVLASAPSSLSSFVVAVAIGVVPPDASVGLMPSPVMPAVVGDTSLLATSTGSLSTALMVLPDVGDTSSYGSS